MEGCELCKREKINDVYYEDDVVWITVCKTCQCPLIVIKKHIADPTQSEKHYCINKAMKVCGRMFRGPVLVDEKMRTIKDHWHAHLRLM